MKTFTTVAATSVVLLALFALAKIGMGQPEEGEPEAEASLISSIRGGIYPVRPVDPADNAKLVSVETFRDEDFGTLTTVASSGSISSMPYPHSFDVRIVSLEDGLQAIRFMTRLGSAWLLEEGEWVPLEEVEEGSLFPGDYEIYISAADDGESLQAVRVERITGTMWLLGENGWVEVLNPEDKED